jgi:hypothetical protein
MTTDPDPFEEGQRAARENIPAEGNPYQDGSAIYGAHYGHLGYCHHRHHGLVHAHGLPFLAQMQCSAGPTRRIAPLRYRTTSFPFSPRQD